MIDHLAAHLALRARLLAVNGLPAVNAFENKAFTPVQGTPYVADQYVPATQQLVGLPAQHGIVEETGLYVVQLYGVDGAGITPLRTLAQAVLAAFTPGTVVTSTANDAIRVRGDVAPMGGQIIPRDDGWATCTIKIPWRAYSQNLIAA